MLEVLVATPIDHFNKPYKFKSGLEIRSLAPILWERSIVKGYISKVDRDYLESAQLWLCASKQVAHSSDESDELYGIAQQAMYAIQIICPCGGKNIYLKFELTKDGYDNIGSNHPREMTPTLLGRLTFPEQQGLPEYFDLVYEGVRSAFTTGLVRLQNPILLLVQAMQMGNSFLSILMTVMGLDMLFMAGEKKTFVPRIAGFLRPHSRVFPKESILDREPIVEVEDVIRLLYDFRNLIAHGREIPRVPYRQEFRLLTKDGCAINHDNYYLVDLLQEAGLFMLAFALRRVLAEGLLKTEKQWKQQITIYERRYEELVAAGRPEATVVVLRCLKAAVVAKRFADSPAG